MRTCSRLFGALLERGELFVGHLPPEDTVVAGERPCERGMSSPKTSSQCVQVGGKATTPHHGAGGMIVFGGMKQDGFNGS